MQVIGVVDLLSGRAVHARAGQREHYQPVSEVGGSAIESGRATAVAREYVERLGLTGLYVADLDAILGRPAQEAIVGELVAFGVPLWLDAGATTLASARRGLGLGARRVVIGLETLTSFGSLREICEGVGGGSVAFSLDLRMGEPIVSGVGIQPGEAPQNLAVRAVEAGADAVIVIDLARVGTGQGIDWALVTRLRRAAPDVTLLVGGGVRSVDDLLRLSDAGCDAALVATALHDGRLTADDVEAAQRHCNPR
jgi:phosphoribosylformimino-5-aminoimidazole carboxamide ribotide isomerase